MKCELCPKEMILISSYDNPDVCAGERVYQCPDHPRRIERTQWYCPYIPLSFVDGLEGIGSKPPLEFKTRLPNDDA